MAFVLNKRAVHVNLRNPNLPQLPTKNAEVFHEVHSPSHIPARDLRLSGRTIYQQTVLQFRVRF